MILTQQVSFDRGHGLLTWGRWRKSSLNREDIADIEVLEVRFPARRTPVFKVQAFLAEDEDDKAISNADEQPETQGPDDDVPGPVWWMGSETVATCDTLEEALHIARRAAVFIGQDPDEITPRVVFDSFPDHGFPAA